jgi:release factor glutamine methyltransferase
MCFLLGRDRSYLHAWPEQELDARQLRDWNALLQRRLEGEPVAYITGSREFWSLPLNVGAGVLIPRPDTERLVELALERLPGGGSCEIADLGTGSGAIALALASERPDCRVIAVDRSSEALVIARQNARRLQLGVEFRQGDWCAPLAGEQLDMIVSNPPYIRHDDPHLQQGDVRFEPASALVAGQQGLDDIRRIAEQARGHLKDGGWLLLEHGWDQQQAVVEILRQSGYSEIEDFVDLAGQARVCAGKLKQA